MIPVVFAQNRGWLGLPLSGSSLRAGVIIFGAYGFEDLSTRYSMARLADRLIEAGHPVLRFDLPGTGDSLGDWRDPGQFAAWIAAGHVAVNSLHSWSGVGHVSLIGLRLGGTVATLVAQGLQDAGSPVSSLALLGPVLQGRQYLRELRALADGVETLPVGGFHLSAETQSAMAAVDISKLPKAPAKRVFLGVPGNSKAMLGVQAQWAEAAELSCVPYANMAQHIGDSITGCAPSEMFDQLVEWFAVGETARIAGDRQGESPHLPRNHPPDPEAAVLKGDGFSEEGVIIAAQVGLAGVWCRPVKEAKNGPVLVFCNSGRNPHIGGARGNVVMARRLAREGLVSLRFDLAGHGDSPPLPDPPAEMLYNKLSILQLRAVLDYVEGVTGDRRVCLVGICSGGHLAFHETVSDSRVVGLVLVNVPCFVWRVGMSLHTAVRSNGRSLKAYQQRLFFLDSWKRLMLGKLDVAYVIRIMMHRAVHEMKSIGRKVYDHFSRPARKWASRAVTFDSNPKDAIRQGFATIASTGTKITVIYGEEDVGRDEFARYFGTHSRSFLRLPNTRLLVLPNFDHDVTQEQSGNQLLKVLLDLLTSFNRSRE